VTLVAKSVKKDKILTVKPLETIFDVSNGTMQTILMRFLNEIVRSETVFLNNFTQSLELKLRISTIYVSNSANVSFS